jgi:hypothetical protein
MKKLWFQILAVVVSVQVNAQSDSDLCLTGGAAIGRNVFAEIGLAKRTEGDDRHGSLSVVTYTLEIKPGQKTIIAPKIGLWGWSMTQMAIGLNLAYYTDFDKGSLVFRPELGIGLQFGKLVYGYNAPMVNKDFGGVNRHQVVFAVLMHLKDIKPRLKKKAR